MWVYALSTTVVHNIAQSSQEIKCLTIKNKMNDVPDVSNNYYCPIVLAAV